MVLLWQKCTASQRGHSDILYTEYITDLLIYFAKHISSCCEFANISEVSH